jgi:hypothetical protein
VADHARQGQAVGRLRALFQVVPVGKARIRDDGAARDLVEGDVLGRLSFRAAAITTQ